MNYVAKALMAASVSMLAMTAQAQTRLIANEPGPNKGVRAEAVNWIAEQIEERTGGDVGMELFHAFVVRVSHRKPLNKYGKRVVIV